MHGAGPSTHIVHLARHGVDSSNAGASHLLAGVASTHMLQSIWVCREKELLKALAAQEKEVLRMRQREAQTGPKDDLDLEWQSLLDAQRCLPQYDAPPFSSH